MAEGNSTPDRSDVRLKKDPGRCRSSGAEFEYLLAGLLSLRARRAGLRYQIFTNVLIVDSKQASIMNAFDDLVLRVWFAEGDQERFVTYYFQLKQGVNQKRVTYNVLACSNNEFSVVKYFKFFQHLQALLNRTDTNQQVLSECSIQNSVFVLYTTHSVQHNDNEGGQNPSTWPLEMNTGESGDVFVFSEKDAPVWNAIPGEEEYAYRSGFLPKMLVFQNQKNPNVLKEAVGEDLASYAGPCFEDETYLLKYEKKLKNWSKSRNGKCISESNCKVDELLKEYLDKKTPPDANKSFAQFYRRIIIQELERHRILHVNSGEITYEIMCAKIFQALKAEKKRCTFLYPDVLRDINKRALVNMCAKLCDAVIFNSDTWPDEIKDLLRDICSDTECKIIIVSNEQFPLRSEYPASYAEVRDEWSLAQTLFLDQTIIFQGQSVKLQAVWPQLTDGPTLCVLPAGRPMSAAEATEGSHGRLSSSLPSDIAPKTSPKQEP